MHLTRFRLNTARTGARRLLESPQRLHAAVQFGFPEVLAGHGADDTPADQPRALWRLDHISRAEAHLYVVSQSEPDLTHLVEQAGWPHRAATTGEPGWQTHHYRPFLNRLAKGDTFAFRLTANPVHSVRRHAGEPTKRTAHVTPRHQLGWLTKRQEAAGFRLLSRENPPATGRPEDGYEVVVHNRRDLSFTKSAPPVGKRAAPVTLVTVTFDGRLEVTDPEALRRTLTLGLGKAKAYGCGLMTLAPLP
ncbi:type I-E CRISPR-associated protein Cas6/Cse3/CasE [Streptomyces alkaliterrae]|uniref:Type I-E CRISPR-associated protein Cas6/Cse3/CasE n=1 Tax=Streptomyces alkaliterrae TaxID=2213162 RepID=A0A5P0YV34_9ACTN|nr:type I-E CRISPR-associated protein Cas6/Cse3/CasE [Streptomyces alkaliterrae]MBB1255658.1 type I-E CRISPR-associated protein Cas6/Cse3/CasE [Streptomyces alkaliterrae]MBB1261797.1 type I-E CRISPR-associated protein Cas6/Cse3/CasE [Streptomyces alkaliterrae]MQS04153.1 type I-E CRISPR-associated protein Cas6/Cse3/CasE [Streptomyces alkaliterrae]